MATAVTKAALCITCTDIVSPHRAWAVNRAWRWCECTEMGVRWRDGARGLLEVTALHGPDYLRVIGINNMFLTAAVKSGATFMAGDWRDLHERCAELVEPYYLFHKDNRACWALIVRVGESGDVSFIDYPTARYPTEPSAEGTT